MAGCFCLLHEMINYDVSITIVFLFYADTEENNIFVLFLGNLNFRTSYLENGLADFGDTHISFFNIFKALSK